MAMCYPAPLIARKAGGQWRVARVSGAPPADPSQVLAEQAVDRAVAAMEARIKGFDPAWQQELTLTVCNRDRLAFAASEMRAEALVADGDNGSEVAIGLGLRFSVEQALDRAGARIAGRFRRRADTATISLLALAGALVWLLVLSLRAVRWPRLDKQVAGLVVALHAEDANRTRHVRKALATCDPATTEVLFVGRPHLHPDQAAAMLQQAGWTGRYMLAWDWRAVLGGLSNGVRIACQAAPAILAAGYRPDLTQLVAINLRILLGAASAWRWRASTPNAEAVVFGHIGRSDTVLLECAIRAGGAKTVHWMHGLSDGRSFQGTSDLCSVLCQYDRDWHGRALNYGRTIAFPLPRPPFRVGSRLGCVVMTNFTHPDYAPFAQVGPAHELQLIDMVSHWAKGEALAPSAIVWKPHPVFYQRDPAIRQIVTRRLAHSGFTLWPEPVMPFDAAANYETVIVTPSGVAVDMLKQGRLPVMVALAPVEPEHVLARFPLQAHDPASLRWACGRLREQHDVERLFEATWDAVGPGEQGDLERILAALAERG